jgi:HD-like signal output (HDOD) protein
VKHTSSTADLSAREELVAQRVREVSSIPAVALRVIEITNDLRAGAQRLKAVMEGDASLSARVLRLVNSSAYGIRNEVTNLQMAIAYLGFRQIRNLALTASISDIFRDDARLGTYTRPGLWRHLVSVGIASRMIAMRRSLENFEDAFLAGLLHDIGIIFEDQYDHAGFRRMILNLDAESPLEQSEQTALGYSHTQLGSLVARQWRFPALAAAAIEYHHHVKLPSEDWVRAVHCVQVANMLCALKNISSVGIHLVRAPVEAVAALGFTRADLEALSIDLDEELERNSALLAS